MAQKEQHPIWIEVVRNESLSSRWNRELVLCWQMTGSAILRGEKTPIVLQPDTLVLIPIYRLFNLEIEQGQALLFHIDTQRLDSSLSTGLPKDFSCFLEEQPEKQNSIKILLAKLTRSLSVQQRFNQLLVYSQLFSLLYELCAHFSCRPSSKLELDGAQLQHMEHILHYMDNNYTSKLSLDDLGKQFFMSPTYFSRLFKRNMGITPGEYLSTLRLNRAVRMLTSGNEKLEEIADCCGFADIHAFIRTFKQMYQLTPGQYRKGPGRSKIDKPNLTQPDTTILEKYWDLAHETLPKEVDPELIRVHTKPVSFRNKGTLRNNSGMKFIFVDYASMLLQSGIQNLLRKTKTDINIEFVYFHGLLDDSIPIYTENLHTGKPTLIYQNLDHILDFIVSIGMKPVIEFSYMPRRLATELRMPGLVDNAIISMPNNIEKWNFLITGIVEHIIKRYGKKEAESWLYCCWHIPDLKISHFSLGSDENYYTLYSNTWQSVKSVNPELQFGIPNMVGHYLEEGSWFNDFLAFCQSNNCMPDFFGYNCYAISQSNWYHNILAYRTPTLSTNQNALNDSLKIVKSKSKEYGWNIPKLYVPLWDYCFSGNPLEDTTFRAVYIIKNILENMDESDGFGCGHLTDCTIYSRMSTNTYYGLPGLFTGNNIPKAAYYAFSLLARLGNQMLARGEGWCVTKRGDSVQLLFYYYEHFSEQYAQMEYFGSTNSERYLPFNMDTRLKITVPLTDLPYEKYLSSETVINRSSGSSFDKWLEMGGLPIETPEMTEYLRAVSTPKVSNYILDVRDGTLDITVELEPLEIRMIELRP